MEFLFKSRSEGKRQIKPSQDIQYLEDTIAHESSEDSDFKIDTDKSDSDKDNSSSSSDSSDNNEEDDSEDDDSPENPDLDTTFQKLTSRDLINLSAKELESNKINREELFKKKICGICLGESSNDLNEIVECDGCGISVHEGCYGVTESGSIASTVSDASTEPWFCDPCKCGLEKSPVCELCPNIGGVYKETEAGRFVHLVCALYVHGVAFGDPDKLSHITVFEINYSNYGKRICTLCEEARFCKTGICIQCDAGMCKQFFHAVCAQAEGLLAEPAYTETDPYIAHCRLHSDKTVIKKRKKIYMTMLLQSQVRNNVIREESVNVTSASSKAEPGETPAQRIRRKLNRRKARFAAEKEKRILNGKAPFVPLKRMPRLISSSSSAIRKIQRLRHLATGMDLNRQIIQDSQLTSIRDIKKKWHCNPAFNVEFVAYYQERHIRVEECKKSLTNHMETAEKLRETQTKVRPQFEKLNDLQISQETKNKELRLLINNYRETLKKLGVSLKEETFLAPLEIRPNYDNLIREKEVKLNHCKNCRETVDQHLLVHCDTCSFYYHLGCLTPPLSRMPKRSKLYTWQCSECDKLSSDEERDTSAPRKLRKVKRKSVGMGVDSDIDVEIIENVKKQSLKMNGNHDTATSSEDPRQLLIDKAAAKAAAKAAKAERKKMKKERKKAEKLKKNSGSDVEIIEEGCNNKPLKPIKIKNLMDNANSNGRHTPELINLDDESSCTPPPQKRPRLSGELKDVRTSCDKCGNEGNNKNLVRCDECRKCYHFSCMIPPLKKSPKVAGYGWHCFDCDPSDQDSDWHLD